MQGQLLKKFKETGQFLENVGPSQSTIYFKIGLYKFLKKYPKSNNQHCPLITLRIISRRSKPYVKQMHLHS